VQYLLERSQSYDVLRPGIAATTPQPDTLSGIAKPFCLRAVSARAIPELRCTPTRYRANHASGRYPQRYSKAVLSLCSICSSGSGACAGVQSRYSAHDRTYETTSIPKRKYGSWNLEVGCRNMMDAFPNVNANASHNLGSMVDVQVFANREKSAIAHVQCVLRAIRAPGTFCMSGCLLTSRTAHTTVP
jgi:hypothetical protein